MCIHHSLDGSTSGCMNILSCRFPGATPFYRAQYGQGTGPILLDNLLCNSRETRLIDCPHNGIGVHNCIHSEDAGLRCQCKLGNDIAL